MDCLRPQRLYFLRKVHKTPHKLRPIVSCYSGPTHKLSKLANRLLAEYLKYIPSLVNNSSQVINCVEELQIPAEARKSITLATLDVKSLYPFIPQGLGVTMALQQAIPTNPPGSDVTPSRTC